MKLTNKEIYAYAVALNEAFTDTTQRLPMKVNFYFQKNKKLLTSLGQDLEESRMEVLRTYGEPSEDGTQYIIPEDKIKIVQQELFDLFALEQDIDIHMIKADSLPDDIDLTMAQMDAIMFMID